MSLKCNYKYAFLILQQSTDRLMKSMETVKVLVLEVEKLKREEFR